MSLIVQVNSSNATAQAAAAASQPSQQPSNIVTTAAAGATTVQVAVNAANAQSPPGSVVHQVPAMQAQPPPPPEPMPNSLATLVAAAEQQSKQKLHQIPTQVRTESTITRIMSPHIVQHHPPPLRMVQLATAQPPQGSTVVTTVALPQSPAPVPSLRHALPQSPMVRAPQLPRSPVRQHQLPTAPLQRSLVQQHSRASPVQQLRTGAMTVTNGGQQCIMVNNPRTGHLSMLPQTPSPGILPSAASVQGLLPQSPSTLVPLPAAAVAHAQAQHHHHRIQQTVATPPSAAAVTNNSTTILPPTLMNRQLFSRSNVPSESASDG